MKVVAEKHPTAYTIQFNWLTEIIINATATVVADSPENAKRIFLEQGGDPNRMENLKLEESWVFHPGNFIQVNPHSPVPRPFEINDIQPSDDSEADLGSVFEGAAQ